MSVILIDATHPEEARVVLLDNNKIVDLDYEVFSKKQIKGNIYLAKVTKVERSLQAAFIEYGGNKSGFLPFSEIHPTYYQIPEDEKAALLNRQEKNNAAMNEDIEPNAAAKSDEVKSDEVNDLYSQLDNFTDGNNDTNDSESKDIAEDNYLSSEEEYLLNLEKNPSQTEKPHKPDSRKNNGKFQNSSQTSDIPHYKIQDVIKEGQVLLVQAVKEERGSINRKGASFSSYILLAGRLSIYMPNTPGKGGVSKRIFNMQKRRNLKSLITSLSPSKRSSVIIRTEAETASMDVIKHDLEYLHGLWESIRLNANKQCAGTQEAPCQVYTEGDIIKRTFRDLYSSDVKELIIEGNDAFKSAETFIKDAFLQNKPKIRHYKGVRPIFVHYKIEEQLLELYSSTAQLPSGGYIVINATEALVSIDVNSGSMTNRSNIEKTAFITNREAAAEIGRQLKLRNLSGLIVVDFIDMADYKNIQDIENKIKSSFQDDRAKTQFGSISQFCLFEMSRQRLKPSFLEVYAQICPKCSGAGYIRAVDPTIASIFRALKSDLRKYPGKHLKVITTQEVVLQILNNNRTILMDLDGQHKTSTIMDIDTSLKPGQFRIAENTEYAPAEVKNPDTVEFFGTKTLTKQNKEQDPVNKKPPPSNKTYKSGSAHSQQQKEGVDGKMSWIKKWIQW